jgi:cytochrome c-type biogenesis protein
MPPDAVGLLVAFSAGVLSFLSPCVLPLVPSYVGYLTGMSLDELADPGRRRRWLALGHGALFSLGFSLVFIAMGASATFLGSLLIVHRIWIERIGGLLIILFGLVLMGAIRFPGAGRDWRVHLSDRPVGYLGSVMVGIVFAAGWTPCIGPVLGGILTLAAASGTVLSGILLLAVYSLGLALPFLFAAGAMDRFLAGSSRLRRWMPWINRISGALLIAVGILLITGLFTLLSAALIDLTPDFIMDRI